MAFHASTLQGVPEPGGKEDEREHPHPPYKYGFEYEIIFNCLRMTAHVSTGQVVAVSVSGTLEDGHTFSGVGSITTHP